MSQRQHRSRPRSRSKPRRSTRSGSRRSEEKGDVQVAHSGGGRQLGSFYSSGPTYGLGAPVQTKLTMGHPNDRHEQEAERAERDIEPGDERAMGSVAASAGGAGGSAPLPPPLRSYFEPRVGADLGDVSVHTGAEAIAQNRTLGSEAFTRGSDIYFNSDRYSPGSRSGLSLLAHELTHVAQQRSGAVPDVQAAFPDDLTTRPPVVATPETPRPAGMIRVPTASARMMYVPYHTYPVAEVPDTPEMNGLGMQSTIAPFIREPFMNEEELRSAGLLGQTDVTLGHLRNYASQLGKRMNVMISYYDGAYHLAGFDHYEIAHSSQRPTEATEGFVEADRSTSGVGRLMVAERVRQILLQGVGVMHLEIGATEITDQARKQATIDFHQRLWLTIGRTGSPPTQATSASGNPEYRINLREMVRLLAEWGDLPSGQREGLIMLSSGTAELAIGDVQRVLRGEGGPGGGGNGSPGGALPGGNSGGGGAGGPAGGDALPEGTAAGISQILGGLQARTRTPAQLPSVASLRDPATVQQVITGNNGLAMVGGGLYRVAMQNGEISATAVPATPLAIALGPGGTGGNAPGTPPGGAPPAGAPPGGNGPGGALAPRPPAGGGGNGAPGTITLPQPPGGGLVRPPVLNLRPAGNIVVGGQVIPPSLTTAGAGDLIVVGGTAEWVVADARTRQPIAGVFSGGQLYRLMAPGQAANLIIDAATGRPVPPQMVTIGGQTFAVVPEPPSAPTGGPPRGGMSRPMAGAGAGLSILAVIQQTLGPYAAAIGQQHANIARAQAEIDYWTGLGANPRWRIWDYDAGRALDATTAPSTGSGIITNRREPYVVDIDIAALRSGLSSHVGNHQDLVTLLDIGARLGTIVKRGDQYLALVNKTGRSGDIVEYDITETIAQIKQRTLAQADDQMRAELNGLPPEALNNIFRLKSGASTPIFRAANGQPVLSDELLFGPNPWVRTLGRSEGGGVWSWFARGHYSARVLVAPANGDALRATMNSVYRIYVSLDQAYREVQAGGRPIISESRHNNTLTSFVAGPDPGGRFGITRYEPEPNNPGQWTAAIGELKQFWVNSSDLEPVDSAAVNTYRNQSTAQQPQQQPPAAQ